VCLVLKYNLSMEGRVLFEMENVSWGGRVRVFGFGRINKMTMQSRTLHEVAEQP